MTNDKIMTSDNFSTTNWPTEIKLSKDKAQLTIAFDNGQSFLLPAEYLRVYSPSAEVQGHSPSERKLVAGKVNVRISDIEEVGNYAIRLIFDDAHDTGIYSWRYLYELGEDYDKRWSFYVNELNQANKTRDGS